MKSICLIFFVILSTALIYAQPIPNGILLGRGTGSTPFDESDEITRQTARHFVAFRWELEGSTDGEFSVGTAAFPQKFTNWTNLTSRDANPDLNGYLVEVHIFAGELPEIGEQIQISIRDGPSGTPINSSLLTVGSTNYGGACPGFYDPQPILGGQYTLPPQPTTISMVYNDTTGRFDFQLDVKYLQWDYTWVVDFVPFENNGTLGTFGLAVTECENHVATAFTGKQFAEYWNAYPRAQDGATVIINSNNFLGYQHETASGTNYADWVLSQVDCSTVRYSASIVPSDLNRCESDAGTPAIDVALDNTLDNEAIVITGALHVTAIRPRDLTTATPADSGADFESVSFQYPFEFRFNFFAEAVEETTASNTFSFTIDKLELIANAGPGEYNMRITITTNTRDADYYLSGEDVDSQPGGVTILFTGADPANVQIQTWILTTTTPKTAGGGFSGSYQLSWTRGLILDDSDQSVEVAEFAITLNVATTETDTGTLGIELVHYDSAVFDTPKGGSTYKKTDRVFIRSEVQRHDGTSLVPLAASEINSFNNDIWGVWICYITGGPEPTDCRIETNFIRPVVTLVSGGNPQTISNLQIQFDPHTHQGLTPTILAGFDFLAQPLVALRGGNGGLFYVHVQSRITDGTSLQKRMEETMYVLKKGVNGFTVEAIADPDPSTATALLPTIFSILICVLSALIL